MHASIGKAYDDEEDKEVARRILAVHYVLDKEMTQEVAADMLFCSLPSVGNWVSWYEEGGVAALRDLPRSGRPPKVGRDRVERIIDEETPTNARPGGVRPEACARRSATGRGSCTTSPPCAASCVGTASPTRGGTRCTPAG